MGSFTIGTDALCRCNTGTSVASRTERPCHIGSDTDFPLEWHVRSPVSRCQVTDSLFARNFNTAHNSRQESKRSV